MMLVKGKNSFGNIYRIFFKLSSDYLIINQSINLFICFLLQNEKYTNICEKKFSKAQEGSEMTIRSSSQLPPSK